MCVLHQLILEIGRARAKTQHNHEKFTQALFGSQRIWTMTPKCHFKNNEPKVWQSGHETYSPKMPQPSFFFQLQSF